MARNEQTVRPEQALPFMQAHQRGDLEAVKRLLAELPALEQFPPRHGTWLHESAAAGSVPLVEFWLARGIDVNASPPGMDADADGVFTPLHAAANADVVRLLVGRGAAVNPWAARGGTPLHRAAVMKNMPLIRALIEAGTDPSITDADGLTPLAYTVKYKQREAEKLLRAMDAPLEGSPPPGRSLRTPPDIDLRKDLERIKAMLTRAVERFTREHPDEPVTAVALAASGIEGYVSVGFDTGEFQGSPWDVTYHEFDAVQFADWQQAYELTDQGVHITAIDGSRFDYGGRRRGDALFQEPFYHACLAALRAMEQSTALAKLERAPGFTIGVEISSGDHAAFWQPDARSA